MQNFSNKFSEMLLEFSSKLETYHLKIVLLLAVGFALASILGYFAWRAKVPSILGYLLAGYLIGPYSPGLVADMQVSEQLAEIGVILMMFGVGLDFKLQDLIKVKGIAIPGAIGQTFISTLLSTLVVYFFGGSLKEGITIGLAIGVASTVVLVRILAENNLLKTKEGHIAVGWLIVEDVITVVILLLLPSFAKMATDSEFLISDLFVPLGILLLKFVLLIVILAAFGQKLVSYILSKVVQSESHELFTLSTLAFVFLIAIGTTFFFGISIALGAFIAGMVIRKTKVHAKALIHSLPMKDAFVAIFFLSVGMLFNPRVIAQSFPLFISFLFIILLVKPAIAFLISWMLKCQIKTSLIVAIALAQIGEFSFILSEEAMKFDFISREGYDVIIACALVSIAINPLIFKFLHSKYLQV